VDTGGYVTEGIAAGTFAVLIAITVILVNALAHFDELIVSPITGLNEFLRILEIELFEKSSICIANVHHLKSVTGDITRCKVKVITEGCLLEKELGPPRLLEVEVFALVIKHIKEIAAGCTLCHSKGVATDNVKFLSIDGNGVVNVSGEAGNVISITVYTNEIESNAKSFFNLAVSVIERLLNNVTAEVFVSNLKFLVLNVIPNKDVDVRVELKVFGNVIFLVTVVVKCRIGSGFFNGSLCLSTFSSI
jgi:hypothetical protein